MARLFQRSAIGGGATSASLPPSVVGASLWSRQGSSAARHRPEPRRAALRHATPRARGRTRQREPRAGTRDAPGGLRQGASRCEAGGRAGHACVARAQAVFLERAVAHFGESVSARAPRCRGRSSGGSSIAPRTARRGADGRPLSEGSVRHHLNARLQPLPSGAVPAPGDARLQPRRRPHGEAAGRAQEAAWLEVPAAALLLESVERLPRLTVPNALPYLPELLATLLLTGGRLSEVLGLEVEDVSLDRRTIAFRPNQWRRAQDARLRAHGAALAAARGAAPGRTSTSGPGRRSWTMLRYVGCFFRRRSAGPSRCSGIFRSPSIAPRSSGIPRASHGDGGRRTSSGAMRRVGRCGGAPITSKMFRHSLHRGAPADARPAARRSRSTRCRRSSGTAARAW